MSIVSALKLGEGFILEPRKLTGERDAVNSIGVEGARAIGEALKTNGIVTSLNLGGEYCRALRLVEGFILE